MTEESDIRCRFGRLHIRQLGATGKLRYPPLLCLHPSPHDGAFFTAVMPLLNGGRDVIAPDYPGYGESAPPASPPSIDNYALAILDALETLSVGTVDVMGFHTGCLVAAEMALRDPSRTRHLVLVDVPFYVGAERADMYARAVNTEALDSDRSDWGFHAAFTYPSDERFPLVGAPATVVATQSALLDPSRAAARALRNARLVERLDITRPVFEKHADDIAAEIRGALE